MRRRLEGSVRELVHAPSAARMGASSDVRLGGDWTTDSGGVGGGRERAHSGALVDVPLDADGGPAADAVLLRATAASPPPPPPPPPPPRVSMATQTSGIAATAAAPPPARAESDAGAPDAGELAAACSERGAARSERDAARSKLAAACSERDAARSERDAAMRHVTALAARHGDLEASYSRLQVRSAVTRACLFVYAHVCVCG